MSYEAYSVAVKIRLINEAAAGIAALSAQFRRVEGDALAVQKRMNEIHRLGGLALASGAIAGAGFAGLSVFSKMLKPAEEFTHQVAQLNQAGLTQRDIALSIAAAWKTTGSVITSSASDNLKAIREALTVFGNIPDTVKYLPKLQMIQGVLDSSLHGQGGVGAKDVAYAVARTLELRKVSMNPERFMQEADLITKAVVATGGKVTPAAMLAAQQYGGQYAATFSQRFAYGILPSLVQELGGSKAGSGLTALEKFLTAGTITPAAAKFLASLKLHGQPLLNLKQYEAFRSGMPGVTALGALQGTKNGVKDPDLWVQNYLMAAFKESGITDETVIAADFGRAISNLRASRTAYILGTQAPRLDKDAGLISQAKGIGGYYDLIKSDPAMAQKALGAAWDNLKTSMGLNVVPILIPALNGLAKGLNDFGAWARSHPNLTKDLVLGFGALSAALAFGGTVGALTFAFRALAGATGIGALFRALTGLTGAVATAGPALVSTATGLRSITAIGGLSGLGGTLGGVAIGLGAVVGVVALLAAGLKAIDPGDVDPMGHPGQRFIRHGRGAGVGEWITDPTLDQTHAGEHYERHGRAFGEWVKNALAATASEPPGTNSVLRDASPQAKPQAPIHHHTHIHLGKKEIAKTVTKFQGEEAARAQTDSSNFDPGLMRQPLSFTTAP